MILKKIKIEPYKAFKGKVRGYGYKGVALTPAEEAAILKINEIIDYINEPSLLDVS